MDQDVKDFLTANFQRLEEKIDHYNSEHANNIIRLQKNDEEHYHLDRDHRATCSENREAIQINLDKTISRFGERLGHLERSYSAVKERLERKIEMLESGLKDVAERLDKNYETILEKLDKRAESTTDWVKTLLPWIMAVAYIIIDKMGVI